MMTGTQQSLVGEQTLVRYLLGLLPEKQTEWLDEASIVDDEIAVRLLDTENDLIDGYLTGTLKPDLRSRFEAVYFANPRLRRRVDAARRFRESLDLLPRPVKRHPVIGRIGAVAASLLLVCGGLYFGAAGIVTHQTDTRPDALAATSATPITLVPQARAAATDAPAVRIAATRQVVRFELRLDVTGYTGYEASILDDRSGRPVWTSGEVVPVARDGASFVPVTVPAAVLSDGDNMLVLTGARDNAAPEPVGNYAVHVVRAERLR